MPDLSRLDQYSSVTDFDGVDFQRADVGIVADAGFHIKGIAVQRADKASVTNSAKSALIYDSATPSHSIILRKKLIPFL